MFVIITINSVHMHRTAWLGTADLLIEFEMNINTKKTNNLKIKRRTNFRNSIRVPIYCCLYHWQSCRLPPGARLVHHVTQYYKKNLPMDIFVIITINSQSTV